MGTQVCNHPPLRDSILRGFAQKHTIKLWGTSAQPAVSIPKIEMAKMPLKIGKISYRLIALSTLIAVLCIFRSVSDDALDSNIRSSLAGKVLDFDNEGKPLINTLLIIAARHKVPMGIEKVSPEALTKPVRVRLERGTVSDLLDLSISTLPDCHWRISSGAVFVFGDEELRDQCNLYGLQIPAFRMTSETVTQAEHGLRISLILLTGQKGIAGHIPGGLPGVRKFTLLPRDAPVRNILNLLVSLDGSALWIGRVPSGRLCEIAYEGSLWEMFPLDDSTESQARFLRYTIPIWTRTLTR